MLETALKALDLCYFEATEAFKALADENVWKRPTPVLLSVGELAGHIAYWEAVRFAGDSEDGGCARDLSNCRLTSPILDPRFGYYSSTVDSSPSPEHLALPGQKVLEELVKVHEGAMAFLKERNPDAEAKAPYWHSNYAELLQYVAFHAAYHTGQMYSVRHLLGEVPPDN
jgi:hypothetical protein